MGETTSHAETRKQGSPINVQLDQQLWCSSSLRGVEVGFPQNVFRVQYPLPRKKWNILATLSKIRVNVRILFRAITCKKISIRLNFRNSIPHLMFFTCGPVFSLILGVWISGRFWHACYISYIWQLFGQHPHTEALKWLDYFYLPSSPSRFISNATTEFIYAGIFKFSTSRFKVL